MLYKGNDMISFAARGGGEGKIPDYPTGIGLVFDGYSNEIPHPAEQFTDDTWKQDMFLKSIDSVTVSNCKNILLDDFTPFSYLDLKTSYAINNELKDTTLYKLANNPPNIIYFENNKMSSISLKKFSAAGPTGDQDIERRARLKEFSFIGNDIPYLIDAQYAFSGCTNLKKVVISQSEMEFNYTGDNHFSYMFKDCSNLQEVDLSGIITKEKDTVYTTYMFSGCTNLRYIDISNFKSFSLNRYPFDSIPDGCVIIVNNEKIKNEIKSQWPQFNVFVKGEV